MRAKVLILTALLILSSFVCGCAVDMSTKDCETYCKGELPITETETLAMSQGEPSRSQDTRVLIKHSDGHLYVISLQSATARKVSGIEQPDK